MYWSPPYLRHPSQPLNPRGRGVEVRRRRGSVSGFVAISLTLLVAIVAIALDGGILLSERRHAQAVADAAALAAASDLYLGNSATTAQQSALTTAAANGYTNDGVSSVITPNLTDDGGNPVHGIWSPPISGDHVGDPNYVEVVVQWNQARGFSSIFGSGAIPVRARSVAMGSTKPSSTSAILNLDPTGSGAFSASGNPTISVNAPITVDSNSSQALTVGGSSDLSAPAINVTGNYSLSGGGDLTGTVHTGVTATPDPLAALVAPDPTTLTTRSSSALSLNDGNSHTLSPGVYVGGISIGSTTSVTLLPGIYYIQGGGFILSGSSNLTGSGVMIYNAPVAASDQISLSGSGNVTLSPPTSGRYSGITIFQDRNSSVAASITGDSGFNVTGTFYIAGATLKVTGNSTAALLGSQLISRDLTIGGKASLTITWDANKVARKRFVQLVE
jgi:Putative Flp pilus-assembly TadE/G-like